MIDWGALGLVGIVSFAAAVAVVVLVSFALVGLSAREAAADGGEAGGMSAGVGTAIAGICLLAVAAIVVYGLYIIVF